MSDLRFDVTFIRGPRDLSPWKKTGRQIEMLTNNPQVDEDVMRARMAYSEKRLDMRTELFPNAIYQEKGRERK